MPPDTRAPRRVAPAGRNTDADPTAATLPPTSSARKARVVALVAELFDLLTPAEDTPPEWEWSRTFAAEHGCTERVVLDACRAGAIVSSRVGRRILLNRTSALAWIESRAATTKPADDTPTESLAEQLRRQGIRTRRSAP